MFSQDLSPYFNVAEFAVAAQLDGVEVAVIFDRAYHDGLGGQIESSSPVCLVPTAAVPSVAQGSALELDGVTYQVTRVEPDGTGVTTLALERSA